MNETKAKEHLVPLVDHVEIVEANLLVSEVADKPADIRGEWLRRHNYAAVPVLSGPHFTERSASALSQAASELGSDECFAVATEPLENTILRYAVRLTPAGLLAFSDEGSQFYFLLVPQALTFAYLCTGSDQDYNIIAGPKQFVETALSESIVSAREKFLEFAARPSSVSGLSETMRNHLLQTAHRYAAFNGE